MSTALPPSDLPSKLAALQRRVTELEQENQHLRSLAAPLPAQRDWYCELFMTMASHANGAIIVVRAAPLDASGPQVIYTNPAVERLFGQPARERLGQPLEHLLGPQLTSHILVYLQRAIQDATAVRSELFTSRPDGSLLILDLELVPIRTANGPISHVIIFQRDLTVLRRTEAERDTLLTRLTSANQQLLAELQARREAEQRLQQLNQHLEHLVDTRTAQLQAAVAELESEVHERRRVSAELQQSQSLLQSFLDHMPAALGVQDLEGRFVLVNEQLLHSVGLSSPDQILGQTPHAFFPEAFIRTAQQERLHIQSTGATVTSEYGRLDTNGQVTLVHSFPIRDTNGTIIAVGRIAMDITAQKRNEEARLNLERQLLEAQRRESIGLLASGIAHDFNNLLAIIQGHAELTLCDLPVASPLHANVEAIVNGVQRAADFTAQMLAYAGKGQFMVEPLQLNFLIQEMANLLRASITRYATVHYQLAAALPLINADAAQIRQVVLNLLVNASEALLEQAGQITITTLAEELSATRLNELILGADLPPGRYVRMSVTDTGCGMDEATRARMFEPFFSTKFTGRGLGLAALEGIIRSHHGALEVLSVPGQGTTIHVWLPACDSTLPAFTPQPATPATMGQGTVLVVDDEAAVRRVARSMLEHQGFHTLEAESGEAVLAMLAAGIPNLTAVLLDLTMPGFDSKAVTRQISRQYPGLRIVLMSGYSTRSFSNHHANLPVTAMLQKPFSLASLQAALRG